MDSTGIWLLTIISIWSAFIISTFFYPWTIDEELIFFLVLLIFHILGVFIIYLKGVKQE